MSPSLRSSCALVALSLVATAGGEVDTSFEFLDLSGSFTLGDVPQTVTFEDGLAQSVMNFALYHTGFSAWMVTNSGTVTFTPASEITLFIRDQNGGVNGLLNVFGTDGSVLASFNATDLAWTTVNVQSTNPAIAGLTLASTGPLPGFTVIDDLTYCAADPGTDFCNGDGGDQMGCTDCPCGNNALPGTIGGCLNSNARSARLIAKGLASESANLLRMEMTGGQSNSFGVLTSGTAQAPANAANPCFGLNSGVTAVQIDGLRCAVQNVLRHGARPLDANGDVGVTTNGWGPPNGPVVGLVNQAGLSAGQTRHFQVIHRDDTSLVCMRGQNTSQGVSITVVP